MISKKQKEPPRIKRQVTKSTVTFPHLVPVGMIDIYLRDSLPYDAAIAQVEVKFATLTHSEYEFLHEACLNERFPSRAKKTVDPSALDLELPKIEMKGMRA